MAGGMDVRPEPEGSGDAVDVADVELGPPATPTLRSEPVHPPPTARREEEEDEDDEHPCLYCYEPTTAATRIVAAPCLCAGELAAQHTACLRQDLEYKMRLHCTVCKFPLQYSIHVEHHALWKRVVAVYKQPPQVVAALITAVTIAVCISVPSLMPDEASQFAFASQQRWFVLCSAFTLIMCLSFFWAGLCDQPVMTLVLTLREPSEEAKSAWLREGPEGHRPTQQLVPDETDARAILSTRYDITVDLREGNYVIPDALKELEHHLHIITAALDALTIPRIRREISVRRTELANAAMGGRAGQVDPIAEADAADADLESGSGVSADELPLARVPSSAVREEASLLEPAAPSHPKPPALARERTAPPAVGGGHSAGAHEHQAGLPRVSSAACALDACPDSVRPAGAPHRGVLARIISAPSASERQGSGVRLERSQEHLLGAVPGSPIPTRLADNTRV